MSLQSESWLQVSGHRFLLRRLECALLRSDLRFGGGSLRTRAASLASGCLLTVVAVGACALMAVLRPQPGLADAPIVMVQNSGALYVRVGQVWHPVLNLASARLIAGTNANPRPVRESELEHTKRGPLLGIPGGPPSLAPTLPMNESIWTICDGDGGAPTTVLIGPASPGPVRRLGAEDAALVTPSSGSPAYLLYRGRRAVVDPADPAVLRALRLAGHIPLLVSQSLLNAVPEAPPITLPRIVGAGRPAGSWLPGFSVGTVLRIAGTAGDEYHIVLRAGVQRIGRVAADLLRSGDSHGTANVVTVAPDVIRAAPVVDTLPVAGFPDRAPALADVAGAVVCARWVPPLSGPADVAVLVGSGLPLPAGHSAVSLAQADGRGPAIDAVDLPPGRSAYVMSRSLSGIGAGADTRYLVSDTGVRFAIHDDAAAHDLGLPEAAVPAPWPVLATLPCGPELAREAASIPRDAVLTS